MAPLCGMLLGAFLVGLLLVGIVLWIIERKWTIRNKTTWWILLSIVYAIVYTVHEYMSLGAM